MHAGHGMAPGSNVPLLGSMQVLARAQPGLPAHALRLPGCLLVCACTPVSSASRRSRSAAAWQCQDMLSAGAVPTGSPRQRLRLTCGVGLLGCPSAQLEPRLAPVGPGQRWHSRLGGGCLAMQGYTAEQADQRVLAGDRVAGCGCKAAGLQDARVPGESGQQLCAGQQRLALPTGRAHAFQMTGPSSEACLAAAAASAAARAWLGWPVAACTLAARHSSCAAKWALCPGTASLARPVRVDRKCTPSGSRPEAAQARAGEPSPRALE